MERPLLNRGATAELQYELIGDDGDYIPARTFKHWRSVFAIESEKLWRIAIPIAMTTLCQFGLNSVTNIFVGHVGDLELSSFSIAMGVINMFSFGFMVRQISIIMLKYFCYPENSCSARLHACVRYQKLWLPICIDL